MALWDPQAAGNAAVYLRLPEQELLEIRNAPFDGKTAVWVPFSETGYSKGKKMGEDAKSVKVERLADGKVKDYKPEQVEPQNPSKYELIEDLANMTYLSEASVVHNLGERYVRFLIYTYSGLFCITVNPYKWLPVYDNHVVGCYTNKRKTEMPPHVYSVADNAYNDMLRNSENQSMLITGESGAGKTVNTKRVIQYFAVVAATGSSGNGGANAPALAGGGTLEDQIVAANPAMEAYGNAKTIRNDNSSRFGKFIRIHFNMRGTLASGDIDTYLLEKSRVTFQLKAERCFHVFYQLCTGHKPHLNEMCAISNDPRDYRWCSLGEIKVKSIDDNVELEATDESFDILGFTADEKNSIWKITAAIMHSGNISFKNKPREEQAELDTETASQNGCNEVCRLFGIEGADYVKAMCSPKVKVGTEYVTKGQTVQQCIYSLAALTKGTFGRLFDWLLKVINRALGNDSPKDFFIGILDIAGFEIFEYNTFEQLCINYTNERLQQFFNHHMFILEQEEYKKEGIDWVFEDFGMDLQASLDLIEKPLGIMSMLEEECMVPKGTDMTYKDKLIKQHLGKSKAFGKIKKQGKIEAHFELYHYAGTVQYNVVDWLLKNKDPLNTSVIALYKASKVKVVQEIWESYVSADDAAAKGKGGKGGKRQKGGSFQTVSALHRESLNRLMTNLKATQPHFIRCIIPNEIKKPGYMDNNLVLHQLRCNGVLEGIRICRKGFPSRVIYDEWRQRYTLLAADAVPKGTFIDAKKACEKLLAKIPEISVENYRFGHTKLFFKAGMIGALEDLRDDKINSILTALQTRMRYNIARPKYLEIVKERDGARVVQSNWRAYIGLKDWPWQKLLFKLKPLLKTEEKREQMEEMARQLEEMKKELAEEKATREKYEQEHRDMAKARNKLRDQQSGGSGMVVGLEAHYAALLETRSNLEAKVKEYQERLEDEEEINIDFSNKKEKLTHFTTEQKAQREALKVKISKVQDEKEMTMTNSEDAQSKLSELRKMKEALTHECVKLDELRILNVRNLQEQEVQIGNIAQVNSRLQEQVDSAEVDYELEKKAKDDIEGLFKKLESEVRMSNGTIMDIRSDIDRVQMIISKASEQYERLNDKYEDELSSVVSFQTKIKTLTQDIDKYEEHLDLERIERNQCERAKTELENDFKMTRDQFNETENATQQQTEINKKLVIDISRLQRDLDEKKLGLQSALDILRKKFADQHADTIHEVSELEKHNQKLERESNMYRERASYLNIRIKQLLKARTENERLISQLEDQDKAIKEKCTRDDHNLSEMLSNKARMITEIQELKRTLNEKDAVQQILFRNKNAMMHESDALRKEIEEQIKGKQQISVQMARSKADHAQLEEQYSSECEAKKEVQRQFDNSINEVGGWKSKYENDAVVKISEMEEEKKRLGTRLAESDQSLQNATARCHTLEKNKSRLQQDIKDISTDLDRSLAKVSNIEKRQRTFDKQLSEEQDKYDRISLRLKEVLEERKIGVHQVFQSKQRLEELEDEYEASTKESKKLVEEVADLKDQITEGKKSMEEINKAKIYLEKERNDLQKLLTGKEDLLEQLEAKTILFQLNLKKCKSDMESIVADKEVEADTIRKNTSDQVVQIQGKLEEEIRKRADVIKQKKKTESQIADLEAQISGSTKYLADLNKNNKEIMIQIKEKTMEFEQNERICNEVQEQKISLERRMNVCDIEVEELREAVEKAEKLKKNAATSLLEAKEHAGLLSTQNTALHNQKRKLELQLQMIASEVEESFEEAKLAMEKAKKANFECAQLGEEYKKASDHTEFLAKTKASLDAEVKSLQDRIAEQEEFNVKGSKRSMQRLQDDISELESKVEEKRKENEETAKTVKKLDRKYREALMVLEEERKFLSKQQEEFESNQIKVRKMKNELEDIESQCMLFNSKARKLASDLQDVEEKVEHAEITLDTIWGK